MTITRVLLDYLKYMALLAPALALLLLAAAHATAGDGEAERNARDRVRLMKVTDEWRTAEKEVVSIREKALEEARASGGKSSLKTESALSSALERSDRLFDHVEEVSLRLGVPIPDRAKAATSGPASSDAVQALVSRARADLRKAFKEEARRIARRVKLPPMAGSRSGR